MTEPRSQIDELFARWDRPDSPGCSVAVLDAGEIAFAGGYGQANLEHPAPIDAETTVFHVASVSKQFTAYAIALLEAEGALNLDDDVRTHLPWLHDFGTSVTIRHLIHHVSGIRDQWELFLLAGGRLDDVITMDDIRELLDAQRELNFPPGSEHLYSNSGYTLLAMVVEAVAGHPFPDFCGERIFDPAGMSRTHFHLDHQEVVPGRADSYARPLKDAPWRHMVLSYANVGATSLFTTASDLARWGLALQRGTVGGKPLVERIQERYVLTGGEEIDYAFGLSVGTHRGARVVRHSGADAAFRAHFLWLPEQGVAVALCANAAEIDAGGLAMKVAEVWLADRNAFQTAERPDTPTEVAVSADALIELTGAYADRDGSGRAEVVLERGGLRLRTDEGTVDLEPLGDDRFAGAAPEGPPLDVRFVRDDMTPAVLRIEVGIEEKGLVRTYDPAPTRAGADGMSELAGDYWSSELGALYRLLVVEDRLTLIRRRHGTVALIPANDGSYTAPTDWSRQRPGFSIRFDRDGFRLSGGRVRNLRFDRRAGPAR